MNILWAGPLQSKQAMLAGTAPHPATMRWQRMFIGGLRDAGHSVCWIGHEPHRTWPWGPMLISAANQADVLEIDPYGAQIGYTNVSTLRNRSLRAGYRKATIAAIRARRPRVVLTYNADPWMQGVADATMLEGVPWFPLILECSHDPLTDSWTAFRHATARARGVAFISHWAFEQAPVANKHLLAGAVMPRTPTAAPKPPGRPPMILYAGAHSRAGGIDRLVAAMPLLKSAGARLVITGQGKGLDADITRMCECTPGVEDFGMVSESRLAELATAADVLVNPRPLDFEANRTNFPSKLLDYLSYNRPIVSTRTAGIGPGYDGLVRFTSSDTPADIAAAIDDVLGMRALDRSRWMHHVANQVNALTPERAARNLTAWLQQMTIDTSGKRVE